MAKRYSADLQKAWRVSAIPRNEPVSVPPLLRHGVALEKCPCKKNRYRRVQHLSERRSVILALPLQEQRRQRDYESQTRTAQFYRGSARNPNFVECNAVMSTLPSCGVTVPRPKVLIASHRIGDRYQ